jgi:hypothetical protein
VVTICTASLTFNSSTFCPHSVFMCFVWIWEQTAIISLYSINWLVFITEIYSVYCAVRTVPFHITHANRSPYSATPAALTIPLIAKHGPVHNFRSEISCRPVILPQCTASQCACSQYFSQYKAAERVGETCEQVWRPVRPTTHKMKPVRARNLAVCG